MSFRRLGGVLAERTEGLKSWRSWSQFEGLNHILWPYLCRNLCSLLTLPDTASLASALCTDLYPISNPSWSRYLTMSFAVTRIQGFPSISWPPLPFLQEWKNLLRIFRQTKSRGISETPALVTGIGGNSCNSNKAFLIICLQFPGRSFSMRSWNKRREN